MQFSEQNMAYVGDADYQSTAIANVGMSRERQADNVAGVGQVDATAPTIHAHQPYDDSCPN